MVKIKCCGMTNLIDCRAAIDLGADYIGFVFYKKSARYIAPETVSGIMERIRGEIRTVGVFVEEPEEQVERIMSFCGLDYAQVYSMSTQVEKRIVVYPIDNCIPEVSYNGLVLFDSFSRGFGGSGKSFDYNLLERHPALKRAFIAGGIKEGNVFQALRLDPYGIDLVSSLEEAKGRKDHTKMKSFIQKVRSYYI